MVSFRVNGEKYTYIPGFHDVTLRDFIYMVVGKYVQISDLEGRHR